MKDVENGQGSAPMVAQIHIPAMNPELKELLARRAEEEGVPLSEYIVRRMAGMIERPDLAAIPRKRMGRPRKKLSLNAG